MKIRPTIPADLPAIRAMYEASGFEFDMPDPKRIEASLVVVDENDAPIMAVYAEKIVQLYLICGEAKPLVRFAGIKALHHDLGPILRAKGYSSADAFLPPQVEEKFGRFLQKRFGWLANWRSFCIHF